MNRDESPRRGYHHGNLREALVQAALDMIAQRGLAGLAIAEIARALGVSPAAPYRHFRDRNALIAEVARRGFERLAADLEAAWSSGRPDAVTAIERCGRAHLTFAQRDPAAYAAMFDPGTEANAAGDAALQQASDDAFAVLRRAADAACARAKPGRAPPAQMVALHIWSLSHGIASLFASPGAGRKRLLMLPEDLLEAGLLIYLQSLGLAEAA
jgi:AcrR family transcriptional regulator